MKTRGVDLLVALIAQALILTCALSPVRAQGFTPKPQAILHDEFGSLAKEDYAARADDFMSALANTPNYQAYVINYRSTTALPGDRDPLRERMFIESLGFRNYDGSRITLVDGGYRSEQHTEFWLIPPGAGNPAPSRTVDPPIISDKKTFLYERRDIGSGTDLRMADFELESVRVLEIAKRSKLRAAEKEASDDEDAVVNKEDERPPAEQASAEKLDAMINGGNEEVRFQWANVGLAEFVTVRKGSTGVLIFYADERRYDIGTLAEFIRRGRDLLAENAAVDRSRLRIVFGGYRPEPEVDFWFVPDKGKPPPSTPEQRPGSGRN